MPLYEHVFIARQDLSNTQAEGLKKLQVEMAPTVAILGKEQRLHFFEVGANPQIGQTVHYVLQSLLQGDDVGIRALENYRNDVANYKKAISNAQRVQRHTILPGELTVDSGAMTPTMKYKRKVIHDMYKA